MADFASDTFKFGIRHSQIWHPTLSDLASDTLGFGIRHSQISLQTLPDFTSNTLTLFKFKGVADRCFFFLLSLRGHTNNLIKHFN